MKQWKRRVIALALAGLMLLGSVAAVSAAEELPFVDVAAGSWYYDDVCYVVDSGVMVGVKADKFDPDGTVTRAMVATIFWRMQGAPEQTAPSSFTDVPEGKWYSEAIAWAEETKIVEGVGKGKFEPDGEITRQDLMTMFCRYAAQLDGQELPEKYPSEMLMRFGDAESIAAYAKKPIQWAMTRGLTRGSKEGTGLDKETRNVDYGILEPTTTATRAQLAAILHRYENPTTGLYSAAEAQKAGNDYIASLGLTVDAELPQREIVGYYPPDVVSGFTLWVVKGQDRFNVEAVEQVKDTVARLIYSEQLNHGKEGVLEDIAAAHLFCDITYDSVTDSYEICVYYG